MRSSSDGFRMSRSTFFGNIGNNCDRVLLREIKSVQSPQIGVDPGNAAVTELSRRQKLDYIMYRGTTRMNADNRSSIRKPLVLSVEVYSFDEHLGRTQTRDINLDGAFLESCTRQLHPNEILELHVHVHDNEQAPLRLSATVIQSTEEGVDVAFDYGAREYSRLLNTISAYASDGHTLNIPGFWYMGSSVN